MKSDLLSDRAIDLIIFRLKASLRSKEYDRILRDSVSQLTGVLNGEKLKFENESNVHHNILLILFVLISLFGMVVTFRGSVLMNKTQ
jgi:hypothetical protein